MDRRRLPIGKNKERLLKYAMMSESQTDASLVFYSLAFKQKGTNSRALKFNQARAIGLQLGSSGKVNRLRQLATSSLQALPPPENSEVDKDLRKAIVGMRKSENVFSQVLREEPGEQGGQLLMLLCRTSRCGSCISDQLCVRVRRCGRQSCRSHATTSTEDHESGFA